MFQVVRNVNVELNTAEGCVFSGEVGAVELRSKEITIAINPSKESYFTTSEATQITLRMGLVFHSFTLKNAVANLRDGQLTILAEEVVAAPYQHLGQRRRSGKNIE